jgi:hypothetical protein
VLAFCFDNLTEMKLKRFWFEFEKQAALSVLNLGCGVSAWDRADAETLMQERLFEKNGLPTIVRCIEDVDMRELDQKHVIPNMGLVTDRGIWFPQGYADLK